MDSETDLEVLTPENAPHFSEWPLDELIDYILNVHHRYVREAIPLVYAHTQKVAMVHGDHHPEVVAIARQYESVARELAGHMIKEEQVLFPYIKSLVKAKREGKGLAAPPFGAVQNPIRMMEEEHRAAGDEMFSIRSSSNNYAPPAPLLDHSKNIPAIQTPIKDLYFASMSQVYPWDRGTNYAVEIGRRAAKLMLGRP